MAIVKSRRPNKKETARKPTAFACKILAAGLMAGSLMLTACEEPRGQQPFTSNTETSTRTYHAELDFIEPPAVLHIEYEHGQDEPMPSCAAAGLAIFAKNQESVIREAIGADSKTNIRVRYLFAKNHVRVTASKQGPDDYSSEINVTDKVLPNSTAFDELQAYGNRISYEVMLPHVWAGD